MVWDYPDIEDLIPTDNDELKVLFQVEEESQVDYLLNELKKLIFSVHKVITWDKKTKDICLLGVGQMKGQHILYLFIEYLWKHAGEAYHLNEVFIQILEMIFE